MKEQLFAHGLVGLLEQINQAENLSGSLMHLMNQDLTKCPEEKKYLSKGLRWGYLVFSSWTCPMLHP